MGDFIHWPGWRWVTFAACFVGLAACLWFIVAYQARVGWGWWRFPDGEPNRFGRFLMIRKLLLAGLFTLIISNRWVSAWPGRELVTAFLMWCYAAQTFVPYRLLMMVQDRTTPEKLEAP